MVFMDKEVTRVLQTLNFETLSDAMFRSLMLKDERSGGGREQVLRGLFRSKWEEVKRTGVFSHNVSERPVGMSVPWLTTTFRMRHFAAEGTSYFRVVQ
jgi:hypothetical protein